MTDDRETLKGHLADFVAANLERSKSGLYCCPLCGSGTGRNRTGALGLYGDNKDKWKCQACGAGGDIIDLIGGMNGVDAAEAFKLAREVYGGAQHTAAARESHAPQEHGAHNAQGTHDTQEAKTYIESSRKALRKSQEALGYLLGRGISETTAARAWLGYDQRTRSIVIPYGGGTYYTRRSIEGKEYRKPPAADAGPQPLYNRADLHNTAAAPVFVVEGELDAISIKEAGGHAVALAGAKNGGKLLAEIEREAPAGVIVLSLDNDEAGQAAAAELAEKLGAAGVPFLQANIAGQHKDANEALTADRQAFTQAIQAAEKQARELLERGAEVEREKYAGDYSPIAFIKQFTEDIYNSAANTAYTPTGYAQLDEVLDGGLYEGLYILGAISSLGKTTFIIQAADQIAAAGGDVLIFSLEMARSEIMAKSISRESFLISLDKYGDARLAKTTRGITTGKRWANYSAAEVETIKQAINNYAEYAGGLYIREGIGDIGANDVRQAVAEHIRITGRKPVVVVDYLQLLAPNDPRSTDKQNMDKAVLELKRISRDYKTPVIAISSLNRQSYGAQISMEAFKESGAIEYSSDVLIGLQAQGAGESGFDIDEAKRKDPREIELKILKNRNGRTGDKLAFEYFPLFNLYRESSAPATQSTARRQYR